MTLGASPAPAGPVAPPADLSSVPTPALVIDHRRVQRNIADMAGRARDAGVALWPHAKTHKCAEIAARQLAAGAAGLTVATVAEAEYFAAHGVGDLLLAYPPVGDWRLDRLTAVARRARVRVVLDDVAVLPALIDACRGASVQIPYLWEIDCGAGRLGTPPGEPAAEAVAGLPRTSECPFQGVMTFAGQAYAAADDAALARVARAERDALAVTAAALAGRGIDCPVRSGGTTPTAHHLTSGGPMTEIRPGNYVFYDATQAALGIVDAQRCALSVLATVVGRPAPDRVILDAGSKALAAERMTTRTPGFGFVCGHPGLRVQRLYEQHAIVHADAPSHLSVGDRVRVVPNHACAAANLHRTALVVDDEEELVDIWTIGAAGPGG